MTKIRLVVSKFKFLVASGSDLPLGGVKGAAGAGNGARGTGIACQMKY